MATFDGNTLIITLAAPTAGVLNLDVQRLYSEWKEFQVAAFQNQGFPPAFRTTAGDAINPSTNSVPYFYMRNDLGWRIKPDESDHTIAIEGQLVAEDPTLPLTIPTTGAFTVVGFGVQPVAQVISSGVTLTTAEKDAITQNIMTYIIEAGFTFEQIMRLLGCMAGGNIEQDTDGSYTVRGLDDATARILGDLAANNGRDITSRDAT